MFLHHPAEHLCNTKACHKRNSKKLEESIYFHAPDIAMFRSSRRDPTMTPDRCRTDPKQTLCYVAIVARMYTYMYAIDNARKQVFVPPEPNLMSLDPSEWMTGIGQLGLLPFTKNKQTNEHMLRGCYPQVLHKKATELHMSDPSLIPKYSHTYLRITTNPLQSKFQSRSQTHPRPRPTPSLICMIPRTCRAPPRDTQLLPKMYKNPDMYPKVTYRVSRTPGSLK